jgi:thiol-disulfide isomerase/thioredoxin
MWKNKLLFSIALVLLILNNYCFSSSPWSESNNVIVLTNQNFISKTRQHDVLLVMFYVKWCPYCRRLHPDYEQAGTKLSQDIDFPIYIAKFDCTNDNEAQCSRRYNIQAYPTLRIYRYGRFFGEELNYRNRTTDEIVKTMKALKKDSSQQDPTWYSTDRTDEVKDSSQQDPTWYSTDQTGEVKDSSQQDPTWYSTDQTDEVKDSSQQDPTWYSTDQTDEVKDSSQQDPTWYSTDQTDERNKATSII